MSSRPAEGAVMPKLYIPTREEQWESWISRYPCPATGTGQKLVWKWMVKAAGICGRISGELDVTDQFKTGQ